MANVIYAFLKIVMQYDTKNKTWEENLISVETVTKSSEQIRTLKYI